MLKSIYTGSTILKLKLLFMIVLGLLQTSLLAQQNGSITGKITDKSNNEELIGSNVLILGTNLGASSDIDGNFVIKGLAPGKYNVKISFISYTSLTVENVVVEEGKPTRLDVALESSATELQEVVVTAEALKIQKQMYLRFKRILQALWMA